MPTNTPTEEGPAEPSRHRTALDDYPGRWIVAAVAMLRELRAAGSVVVRAGHRWRVNAADALDASGYATVERLGDGRGHVVLTVRRAGR